MIDSSKELLIDSKVFIKYILEDEINDIVIKLSNELSEHYKDKSPLILGVTNGCIYFMMDLLKKVDFQYEIDFIKASSYQGTESMELSLDKIEFDKFKNKNVLIIEDIIDTGKTMNKIYSDIIKCKPKDVKIITLLNKNTKKRDLQFQIDWIGFNIIDKYVIGYGMDFNNLFRYLKDIYIENE